MNKELIGQLKEQLEKEKNALEKELETFAVEDKDIKDNWEVRPLNKEDTTMEEKADEAQEYDNLISLEHSLEIKLKDVKLALEKIEKGGYGQCEKCGKEIEEQRLLAYPEAKLCMKCNENK